MLSYDLNVFNKVMSRIQETMKRCMCIIFVYAQDLGNNEGLLRTFYQWRQGLDTHYTTFNLILSNHIQPHWFSVTQYYTYMNHELPSGCKTSLVVWSPANRCQHTSKIDVVTSTDGPKSGRNGCVIDVFRGIFSMITWLFLKFPLA